MLGLGSDALRAVPVIERFEINLASLEKAIARDRKRGLKPIGVVGNAGTVGTGAMDPLGALAEFALKEKLWFHVDGAIGASVVFSDRHRELLKEIERADSLAFDLHKWFSQPYDVGCILVADGRALEGAFSYQTAHTSPVPDSLTDSPIVFANRGPELSRALRGPPVLDFDEDPRCQPNSAKCLTRTWRSRASAKDSHGEGDVRLSGLARGHGLESWGGDLADVQARRQDLEDSERCLVVT
jgi:hypothetical protein